MPTSVATYTPEQLHLASKLRPIRFALKVAESLLSRGVSTRDAVSQALDITEMYCKERVYFDVSSNVITASQYRGQYKDPLTLMVTVRYDASNNMKVQELQQLVRDITKGLPLTTAIARYKEIEGSHKTYPTWLRMVGNAGMATGIVMLYTNSLINIVLTFFTACIVDIIIRNVEQRRVPAFFTQAIAAISIILLTSVYATFTHLDIWALGSINPTLIAVGSIMVLVAGLSLAATAQDAIDEFYVTAGARLVKTAMLTTGIIIGVVIGLSIVQSFSTIALDTKQSPTLSPFTMQVIGAAITAAAWALYTQSSRAAIVWAGVVSAGCYGLYAAASPAGSAIASGIASFVIGFSAAIIARFWRLPSIAIINSAIVILVPGYMLYRGLMHFVGTTTTQDFIAGMVTVTGALTIALAIAAGAALGTYIGRPVRSHIIRLYNYVPQLFAGQHKKPSRRSKK